MLSLALLLATPRLALVPAGAYGMPELCRKLTEATGLAHQADAALLDYPVFVAAQGGDPGRVRRLVAAALHAKWREEDGTYRLVVVPPNPVATKNEDFAEFARSFRDAAPPSLRALPMEDVYRMAAGDVLRYGPRRNPTIRPLPPELAKQVKAGSKTEEEAAVLIRRMAAGVFEFGGQDVTLRSLPKALADALGAKLDKVALSEKQRQQIRTRTSDPRAPRPDWSASERRDPQAVLADLVFPSTAQAIGGEMAVALLDMPSFFGMMSAANGDGKVRSVLRAYTMGVDWAVVDGAIVGRVPYTERIAPAQVRRLVVRRLLGGNGGAASVGFARLAGYVASQRPAASDSWGDAGILALSGSVLDDKYLGEYPFNVRLYGRLTPADWKVLRTGEPFAASALSTGAQRALRDLLLRSRTAVMGNKPDPGWWPSLEPRDLIVRASLADEPVLIGWTSLTAEVDPVRQMAHQYDMRRKALGREPLYQPAIRQNLELTISSRLTEESITTGFTDVTPDASVKPSEWNRLPKSVADEFRRSLEEIRKGPREQGGPPPP